MKQKTHPKPWAKPQFLRAKYGPFPIRQAVMANDDPKKPQLTGEMRQRPIFHRLLPFLLVALCVASLTGPSSAQNTGPTDWREMPSSGPPFAARSIFPDLAACGPIFDTLGQPTDIDWTQITRGSEAEVCLFHLFRAMPDLDHVGAWMQERHFAVTRSPPPTSRTLATLSGWRNLDGQPLVRQNFWKDFIARSFGHFEGLTVDLSAEGKVEAVSYIIYSN